jgi:hypothetical protein
MRPLSPCASAATPASPILRLAALEIPDQSDPGTARLDRVEVDVVDRRGLAAQPRSATSAASSAKALCGVT